MISKYDVHPKEIVLADPGYPDQTDGKIRPLLVISDDLFHQNSGFFVCVGITTNMTKDPYLVPLSKNQIRGGKLKYGGQIMCNRIATLKTDVIVKKIAEVADPIYSNAVKKITQNILRL